MSNTSRQDKTIFICANNLHKLKYIEKIIKTSDYSTGYLE